jgi:type III restriction enzyme
VSYVRKIKQKITTLANVHAQKTFSDFLYVGKIWLEPSFKFAEIISPPSNAPALPKSLYATEASMGQFESRIINDIANLDNIVWWHRNLSRNKGFRLNGFLNHYPDFIVKTSKGNVIVIETKGDDRDNSDSELKLKLGNDWEAKAGTDFKYMMVFENNPITGAKRLSDALEQLKQL